MEGRRRLQKRRVILKWSHGGYVNHYQIWITLMWSRFRIRIEVKIGIRIRIYMTFTCFFYNFVKRQQQKSRSHPPPPPHFFLKSNFFPFADTNWTFLCRYAAKRFRKAQCPIVERLVNSLMMHGRNTGRWLKRNFSINNFSLLLQTCHFLCF